MANNFVHQGITSSTQSINEFIVYKDGASEQQPQQESRLVEEGDDEEVFDDASSNLSDMDVDSSFNEYKKSQPEVEQREQKQQQQKSKNA